MELREKGELDALAFKALQKKEKSFKWKRLNQLDISGAKDAFAGFMEGVAFAAAVAAAISLVFKAIWAATTRYYTGRLVVLLAGIAEFF